MSNETCVVSIADIYGADWWHRNKEQLDREWEWSFKLSDDRDQCIAVGWGGIKPFTAGMYEPHGQLRIILHRRKPKPPTLRDVYGVDEVKIPVGWEWTREWRSGVEGEVVLGNITNTIQVIGCGKPPTVPRLILRERPKKVWFKAEEKPRYPKQGDWYYGYTGWTLFSGESMGWSAICATRHEEVDQTVQVVTQADVDGVVNHA